VTDPNVLSLIITGLGTLGFREFIAWMVNRGKVRTDEATILRKELRDERDRKDIKIGELEHRIERIELEKDKIEDEYRKFVANFRTYKLDVYRTLIENGVSRDLLDAIRILDI
jgi:predicted nuclease with TOPRIM domain